MTADLDPVDAAFRAQYDAERPLLDRLRGAGLRPGERRCLAQVDAIYAKGLAACMGRLTRPASRDARMLLVGDFVEYGAKAVLLTGSQRGGDFLNNQLRGQWAEQVVLSLDIPGLTLVPFGPSAAAMPGQDDHRATVRTFRAIILLEGKRPDLLAFETSVWEAFSDGQRAIALDWPERQLEPSDDALVAQAACGIEAKNSTWHYGVRRAHGPDPLSITVKAEELADFEGWEQKTGRPVVFVQVLFDEIYCMSFKRMRDAITLGHLYAEGDVVTDAVQGAGGKIWHRFHLDDDTHLCGTVEFPADSEAVVQVLDDGSVVPYIRYSPARGTCTIPETVVAEMSYAAG